MEDIIPARIGRLDRRGSKAATRSIRELDQTRVVALAQVEHQAQVEAAKAHAIGYVGQQAMQAVTMVSQLEGQLGQACPLAVTRLQGIADITALSIAQVVGDAVRKIG